MSLPPGPPYPRALQTLGWNNARTTPALRALSRAVALVVFVGFISVPVAVMALYLLGARRLGAFEAM